MTTLPMPGGLFGGGLLSPDQRKQALGMGLLSAGGAMMQGGQGGLLGSLGQGLQGFAGGYQSFLDRSRQDRLYDLQLRGLEREDADAQRQVDDDEAARAAIESLELPSEIEALVRARAKFDPQGAFSAVQSYIMDSQKGASPQSALGKLQADLSAGLITQPQFDAQFREMTHIAEPASTTVNVGPTGIDYGEPESGLVWQRNPDGTVKLDERGAPVAIPYQGGKRFQEMQAAEQAAQATTEQALRAGDVVLTDIGRAKQKIEGAPFYSPATGLLGNVLKNVGGTVAADVRALTDTVRANIGFDRLQAMREASPTGGALGQVTERELAFLQSTLGSLEQSQTEEQLLQNLDRLEQIYSEILRKAAAYPNAAQFGFGGAPAPASADNPYSSMSDEEILQKLREEGYLE